MNPIFAAALEVQAFCRARRWKFCFIGALAVQRWGEPRLTHQNLIGTELTPLLELKAAPDAAARLGVILASARDRPGG